MQNSLKPYGKCRKSTEGKNILCTNREIMHLCQVNKIGQYQLDKSILGLRVLRWCFSIYSNLNRRFCKQTVENDQMPHSVASDLGLHYLLMSHKKDTRLIWVKK